MKIGHVLPGDHPTAQAIVFFKQRVEALSGGKVEVRLFPNSQLGSANELIAGCQDGNVEAAVVSAAPLAQHVPELNVLVMPFVFRDNEHQYAVLDGPVGQTLRKRINGIDLVAAAYFDAGSRNIMTKTGPIRTPADLAGLIIRVMDSNALREAVERLGAAAIPMSQGEVYGALQTGVIDGWENNASTCLTFSMHETGCRHFAWTRHVAIPDVLLISERWYDRLPDPVKRAVDQAATETRDHQRALWQEDEKQAITRLQEAGMIFSEVDIEAFTGRFEGFYDAFVARYGDSFGELLGQIQAKSDDDDTP
ncbi:MAG: TRAP transporter substrate-binding protein DctP [Phycisphaerales bacterium]|nr:MAG: TRAP transporter substrate-binding protein DctP [Phycisphaerales bacterium]